MIVDSASDNEEKGSSVLVIVTLEEKLPILHASYIGDSGYMIFRFVEEW